MRNSVRLTEALFAKDGGAGREVARRQTGKNGDGQDGVADGR